MVTLRRRTGGSARGATGSRSRLRDTLTCMLSRAPRERLIRSRVVVALSRSGFSLSLTQKEYLTTIDLAVDASSGRGQHASKNKELDGSDLEGRQIWRSSDLRPRLEFPKIPARDAVLTLGTPSAIVNGLSVVAGPTLCVTNHRHADVKIQYGSNSYSCSVGPNTFSHLNQGFSPNHRAIVGAMADAGPHRLAA
jgi:hypothetical protein